MTPVLFVDQHGATATRLLGPDELAEWLDRSQRDVEAAGLPPDEGLDPAACFRIHIRRAPA